MADHLVADHAGHDHPVDDLWVVLPHLGAGGAQKVGLLAADHFARQGLRVRVLSLRPDHPVKHRLPQNVSMLDMEHYPGEKLSVCQCSLQSPVSGGGISSHRHVPCTCSGIITQSVGCLLRHRADSIASSTFRLHSKAILCAEDDRRFIDIGLGRAAAMNHDKSRRWGSAQTPQPCKASACAVAATTL